MWLGYVVTKACGTSAGSTRSPGRSTTSGAIAYSKAARPLPSPPAHRRRTRQGRPGDDAIVEVARADPTDGTRMIGAHCLAGGGPGGEPQASPTDHPPTPTAPNDSEPRPSPATLLRGNPHRRALAHRHDRDLDRRARLRASARDRRLRQASSGGPSTPAPDRTEPSLASKQRSSAGYRTPDEVAETSRRMTDLRLPVSSSRWPCTATPRLALRRWIIGIS